MSSEEKWRTASEVAKKRLRSKAINPLPLKTRPFLKKQVLLNLVADLLECPGTGRQFFVHEHQVKILGQSGHDIEACGILEFFLFLEYIAFRSFQKPSPEHESPGFVVLINPVAIVGVCRQTDDRTALAWLQSEGNF